MLTKVFIVGNIGKKPELKVGKSGTEFCNFTVATREKKDAEPDWWNITAFNHGARFVANYLDKGSLVLVEGSMSVEKYLDKDGNKRETVKINANNIRGLGRKEEASSAESTAEAGQFKNPFLGGAHQATAGLASTIPDLGSIPF